MTREILFRGFCPNESGDETIILDEEEIMGDWHYWNCFDGISRLNAGFMVTDTVGQWTGLTDKNEKRIFEGDILQLCKATYPCLVYWNGAGWSIERNGKRVIYACDMDIAHDLRNMEVIGNAFEVAPVLENNND